MIRRSCFGVPDLRSVLDNPFFLMHRKAATMFNTWSGSRATPRTYASTMGMLTTVTLPVARKQLALDPAHA